MFSQKNSKFTQFALVIEKNEKAKEGMNQNL
jgi:hypothetical protein